MKEREGETDRARLQLLSYSL